MVKKEIYEAVADIVAKNEYMRNLGLEIVSMDEGEMVARIPVKAPVLNPYGSVHGGALYALADITAGLCACSYGRLVSTCTGNMTYIAPAMNTEYVTCTCRALHHGSKVISVSVELKNDDGTLADTATFTFSILNRNLIGGNLC